MPSLPVNHRRCDAQEPDAKSFGNHKCQGRSGNSALDQFRQYRNRSSCLLRSRAAAGAIAIPSAPYGCLQLNRKRWKPCECLIIDVRDYPLLSCSQNADCYQHRLFSHPHMARIKNRPRNGSAGGLIVRCRLKLVRPAITSCRPYHPCHPCQALQVRHQHPSSVLRRHRLRS